MLLAKKMWRVKEYHLTARPKAGVLIHLNFDFVDEICSVNRNLQLTDGNV